MASRRKGPELRYRIIELSGATIRSGRVYFPVADVTFFPPDSHADRASSGHAGKPVTFRLGGRLIESDIRMSSSVRISPRMSFAFFLRQVKACEGGKLKFIRTEDRLYDVEYLG